MSLEPRTVDDLIAKVRRDLQDQYEPYFWDDEDIIDYLNEAQLEFCVEGAPIIDSKTPEVCKIVYDADDYEFELHPSIQKILNIWREDPTSGEYTSLDILTETNWMKLYPQRPTVYGDNYPPDTSFTQSTRVSGVFIDYDSDYIRFTSPADVAGILRFRVERLPLDALEDGEDKLEVHRKYEAALVAFANYLAYNKQDSETFDAQASSKWLGRFQVLADRAKIQHTRKHSTPGTVVCSFP